MTNYKNYLGDKVSLFGIEHFLLNDEKMIVLKGHVAATTASMHLIKKNTNYSVPVGKATRMIAIHTWDQVGSSVIKAHDVLDTDDGSILFKPEETADFSQLMFRTSLAPAGDYFNLVNDSVQNKTPIIYCIEGDV